jgi:cyclase
MRGASCVVFAGWILASTAVAQPSVGRTTRLAEGVYAVEMSPGPISDSNVLFVVSESDVIVVDANILPSSARAVIAEIRRITPKPVRYVINTHWHSDHHYGNDVYRKEFPGVEFIQHANTRRDIIARDIPALDSNVKVNYPAAAARYRRAIETGKTSQGVDVTPAMRTSFQDVLAFYELFIKEMGVTPIVPGTITVQDSLVFHRGERTIVVRYLGRGNTDGDLVVHLPKEGILATGDLVVHPIPFAFFSRLGDWPGTLRKFKALNVTTIVPGHGVLQRDLTYVDQLAALIESTWVQMRREVAAGAANLDSARARIDVETHRAAFAGTNQNTRAQFDRLFFHPATEAAFNELRGDAQKRN